MLRDVDRSVANWLAQVLPPGTRVRFGAPQASWPAPGGAAGPGGLEPAEAGDAVVGAFLYGIRRDERGRDSSGWTEVRDGDGRLLGRQPSVVHHQLSYMIATWAAPALASEAPEQAVAVEHELLGLVLEACCAADVLPQDELEGTPAATGLPIPLRCGGEDALAEATRLWPGFGIAPRAHLVLELVVPIVPPMVTELGPPVRRVALAAQQLPEPAAASADPAAPPRYPGTNTRTGISTGTGTGTGIGIGIGIGTGTGTGTGTAGSLGRTGRSTITEPPARPSPGGR